MATKDNSATGVTTGAGIGVGGGSAKPVSTAPKTPDIGGATAGAVKNSTEGTRLNKELQATRDWVQSSTDQAVDRAKGVVRDLADTQKRQAVDGIKGLTGALHKAAETLQGEDQDMMARYTHLAADEIDRITDVLQQKDWDDLLSETQSLARRQPALFVAGAMVTGFFLARFLKSSGRDAGPEVGGSAYRRTAASGSSGGGGIGMTGGTV